VPALIGFNVASPEPELASQTGERVEVQEDAETVIEDLSRSETGYAKFELAGAQGLSIWVKRDQVMFVRETG
jgi:hypothetical protein